jgi:hypothetical protein
MSLLNKLLGRTEDTKTKTRTRVCVECGMPVDQHKPWCAIWQTQQDMNQKGSAVGAG